MALNFPANPSQGDTYAAGDSTWQFNGVAWDKLAAFDSPTLQSHEAGTNLSGHRAVRVSNGLAYVCDGTNAAHAGRCIGITTGAVVQGANATIQTVGTMTEPSWTWTDGPVFIGANGIPTQSLSGLAFVQQIGVATSPTSIDINPQLPILI